MLFAFALAFAACLAFSLAMDRHLRQVWPQRRPSRTWVAACHGGGGLLLTAAALTCIQLLGIATGLVYFCGLLTLVVTLLALFYSYRPLWLASMPWAMPPLVLFEGYRVFC